MNIKRNVIFQLESRKVNGKPVTENVPIRMRVIFNGKRIEFTTGYRIDVAKWDGDKQRVKNGCTNKLKISASEINADLNNYEAIIHNIFKEFELLEKIPSFDDIKIEFKERSKKKVDDKNGINTQEGTEADNIKSPTQIFWEAYEEFIKENGRKNDWTNATYEKFAALKNHLNHFKPTFSFDNFTEKGLNDLVDYFRKECNMLNSSIGNQLSYIKWFLRWSASKGYHTNMAFATFKPKLKTTQAKVIFLTDEELTKIKGCTIPPSFKRLEQVRDVLLFCCYTGLRYSDVANLKISDVYEDHIEVTTVKTSDSLIIELNKHSRAILDKYKDTVFKNGRALPVISNQKMNDYIKELGKLAEIDTPIRITQYRGNERTDIIYPKYSLLSTHTGRKTFICMALSLGIPAQVVMKWTGHSDYKAMKPYIDIADDIRASAMSRFDED